MKKAFIEKKFSAPNQAMIATINKILDEYQAQGFRLSLRQLYYQLVARAIVENTVKSYNNVGTLVSNARQAGLIDWDMIEDRGRETVTPAHWRNPADIVRAAAMSFRINKWENQPYHVEVMVEKDALSGVLEPVCRTLDIPITANKGYSSSSTMFEIGRRLRSKAIYDHKSIVVIYLGDHDPSGIDMTRDVEDRLSMYSETNSIVVERIALNYPQIALWNPPENPAKTTDSRFASYEAKFGQSSWELDAVEPATLARLITDTVNQYRDMNAWNDAIARETKMRQTLQEFADTYHE